MRCRDCCLHVKDPLPAKKVEMVIRIRPALSLRHRVSTRLFIFPPADLTAKSFAIQFGPLLVCRADGPLMHPLPQYINKRPADGSSPVNTSRVCYQLRKGNGASNFLKRSAFNLTARAGA